MQNKPIDKVLPYIAFMLFILCVLAENVSNGFNALLKRRAYKILEF